MGHPNTSCSNIRHSALIISSYICSDKFLKNLVVRIRPRSQWPPRKGEPPLPRHGPNTSWCGLTGT